MDKQAHEIMKSFHPYRTASIQLRTLRMYYRLSRSRIVVPDGDVRGRRVRFSLMNRDRAALMRAMRATENLLGWDHKAMKAHGAAMLAAKGVKS